MDERAWMHGSWWALSLWGSTGMDRTSQHHNLRLMDALTPRTMSTQTSGGTHTPLDTNTQRHSHLNWSLPAGRGWHSSSGGRCRCRHSDPAQSASCTTNAACIRHSVHLTTSHSTPLLIHQTTSTSHGTPLLIHHTSSSHHFSPIKPPPPPTAHYFSPIKPPPPPTAHTSHPSNHTHFLQHTPSHLSVILNCTHFIHTNYINACSTPHHVMHIFMQKLKG